MIQITAMLFLIAALSRTADPLSPSVVEREDFAVFYRDAGVEGTFVLYDLHDRSYQIYNRSRADTPFPPASTFKIFNSLVALETAVIKDEEEVIPWDRVDRGWDKWNQDLNLHEALQYSAVWFYQEIARRVGEERMRRFVRSADYGNKDIDGGIDRFWLDGDLRISPLEQIEFLVKLHRQELPFSERVMTIVKEILIIEKNARNTLRAKSGWARRIDAEVGWVGRLPGTRWPHLLLRKQYRY